MASIDNLPIPPAGAHWELREVNTAGGKESLGSRPVLVWDDAGAAIEFYSNEGVCNSLNGTSLLVSQQGIARRVTMSLTSGDNKGKFDDEAINKQIADTIVKFKPRARDSKATPASTAGRRAREVAEVVGEKGSDALAGLLARIKERAASDPALKAKIDAGEVSVDDLAAAVL